MLSLQFYNFVFVRVFPIRNMLHFNARLQLFYYVINQFRLRSRLLDEVLVRQLIDVIGHNKPCTATFRS